MDHWPENIGPQFEFAQNQKSALHSTLAEALLKVGLGTLAEVLIEKVVGTLANMRLPIISTAPVLQESCDHRFAEGHGVGLAFSQLRFNASEAAGLLVPRDQA